MRQNLIVQSKLCIKTLITFYLKKKLAKSLTCQNRGLVFVDKLKYISRHKKLFTSKLGL